MQWKWELIQKKSFLENVLTFIYVYKRFIALMYLSLDP